MTNVTRRTRHNYKKQRKARMQVDDTLLNRLENLSQLKISEEKRAAVIEQLSEIVAFVDNLSELDTQSVSDTFAMTEQPTLAREDLPECDTAVNDDILEHAPHSEEHFFIVPKIIE